MTTEIKSEIFIKHSRKLLFLKPFKSSSIIIQQIYVISIVQKMST